MFTIFAASVFLLTGCYKPADHVGGAEKKGNLVVKITDDPFNIDFVETASITIVKIEIRKADDYGNDPYVLLMEEQIKLDLMDLRNGVMEELVNLAVPFGNYDLIRLYVDEAELKIKDQPLTYNVKVPGGQQSGIKIFIDPVISVVGGFTSELLLDIDLSRSFVMQGNLSHSADINGFIFKPVIRAVNLSLTGSITGKVEDSSDAAIMNAKVWLSKDTLIATSFTDTAGHYTISGITAGIYTIHASKEGYDTIAHSGIEVIAGSQTIQDFIINTD
jgi:hypothetical protein